MKPIISGIALFVLSMASLKAATEEGAMKPFTPAKDVKGSWAMHVDPALPNVLILGDSISIGYTRPVRKLLDGKANVFRPMKASGTKPENCGDTPMGVRGIDRWLGSTKWDVIHFNWGLWDLCYRNPESKTQGKRDKKNGTLSTTPEQYEKNLETMVNRLKKTGAELIWASTTLVPEGEAGRIVGDDIKYNAIAERVMKRHGIPTDDLHALTVSFDGKYFSGPGNVHFTEEGSQRLAEQVAEKISGLLEKKTKPDPEPELPPR
ncbi:SGNH/GDSL hydrolase family protein [Haloferula chungangensis]|uniref:SGNH/GDSL hydrolase family protein n=1 Tax=Haloferula chungangensis TaxID=1048331 RepID=A0ABW2L8P2_9BACT